MKQFKNQNGITLVALVIIIIILLILAGISISSLTDNGLFGKTQDADRETETARNLKKYAETNNIENVFFHGEYKPEERYEFVKNTDIIHNIYNDSNMMHAMSNKYCDGAIFRIPQICTKGSYMGEKVEEYGIGRAVDIDSENLADDIYAYYSNIEENTFKANCDKLEKTIIRDYENTVKLIKMHCIK